MSINMVATRHRLSGQCLMIKIAQITDCHLSRQPNFDYEAQLLAVLSAIEATDDCVAIFATGDIADDGSTEAYQRFAELCSEVAVPVYCVPGNHDDLATMQTIDGLSIPDTVEFEHWQIACLNSAVPNEVPGRLSEASIALARRLLALPDRAHLGLFMHHPLRAIGTAWIDPQRVRNAAEFEALLPRSTAVRWLANGHVHQDRSGSIHNVPWFCTPATCRQFTVGAKDFAVDETLAPGFRIFNLHDDGSFETYVQRVT